MRMPRPLARGTSTSRSSWSIWAAQHRPRAAAGVAQRAAEDRQAVINRVQLAELAGPSGTREGPAARAHCSSRALCPSRPALASPSHGRGDPVRATQTVDLPISDDESLAAFHVVDRLPTSRADELEQVRSFEQAHRARRTVLAKIEQLQESAP